MADEAIVNSASDPEVVNWHPADQRGVDSKVNDLTLKLKLLELEKFNLLCENDETKERVGELMAEIEKLRNGEGEAKKEVARLRSATEKKDQIIQGLKREVEGLKNGRAESDVKVRELELKIGQSEVRETMLMVEKGKAKKKLTERVEAKEREISGLKEKIGDLEARIAMVVSKLQSSKNEKSAAEDALRISEEKAKEMESKLVELQRKLEQEEKVITGLKDKTAETISGRREIFDETEDKGWKQQWPVVAAGSAGTIVLATAVAYVCYSRRQS
ncbi:peroxisomal and mitochondrial division factor 2-like [Rhodamnia argentea]|uniref:Peroxisomal and mitochondrial division factor 2-like n=1 Tax=Rhodamnia argentea TaxID=178133 RepID=A0ABM3HV11_9MYRT|nr:peroxisomal and mitochondrial division factor 2-like [Rhodamnia argentea]